MSDCRVFKKDYPNNSGTITITYYTIGYPVIETDYLVEEKSSEMENDEKFFKFKKLDNTIENQLTEKGFVPYL